MSNTLKFGSGKWAAKAGSVLAYNDENNNFKPLPFTFTRASSATRVNESGLIESVASGVPRIDFLDNADGHLLLEPSRTNQFTYSNDFSNAAWTKSAITATSASATSPDGTNNGWKLQGDGTSTTVRVYETETLTADTTHCLSVFAKKGTNNYIRLLFSSFDGSSSGGYNLDAGTAVGTNASIIDYGNGWYKCVLFANITSPDVSGTINIYVSKSDTVTAFDDTTEASNAYVYIYGAQLEAGSYPTSYIPTSGSSVTRVAETCLTAGNSSIFNDSEGVLYAEMSAFSNDTTSRVVSINDGTSSNRIHLFYFTTPNTIYANYRSGGTTRSTSEYALSNVLENNKFAYKFKSGDFALWVNGAEVDTDTNTTMITSGSLNRLDFNGGGGGTPFYGRVKNIQVYNQALTDSQLAALTS